MEGSTFPDFQHRRYNPLTGEWVLVSPHRMNRPWKGQIEKQTSDNESSPVDPNNPLGPGGSRPNGIINPLYDGTFVFENDFPAIQDIKPGSMTKGAVVGDDLMKYEVAEGKCFVVCFHPDSNVSLATMNYANIYAVIKKLAELCQELQHQYDWIQIFENKGAIMGCSNPHPHCQIWASSFLPTEPSKKDKMQKVYFEKHKKVLLMDYLDRELKLQVRMVTETDMWVCLVPYWAVWPFETYLMPKRHCLRLQDLTNVEIENLSIILKKLLCKYDNLFRTSFPYSMGWHGIVLNPDVKEGRWTDNVNCALRAPTGRYLNDRKGNEVDPCFHWQLHATFLPPLLRSSTVKKFMVGYEMLAEPQRDLTAEKAADILRNLPEIHYREK